MTAQTFRRTALRVMILAFALAYFCAPSVHTLNKVAGVPNAEGEQ